MLLGAVAGLSAIAWELACPALPYGWDLLRRVIDHLSIAFFSVGVVAFVLEFRDWQNYVEERIVRTVVQRGYLRTLSREQLVALQTESMEAFFGLDNLGDKGSFMEYFNSRIRGLIASPYREDVRFQLAITDSHAKGDQSWEIDETVTYSCHAIGGANVGGASWTIITEAECQAIQMTISSASPDFAKLPDVREGALAVPQDQLLPTQEGDIKGYKLDLTKYANVYGLCVRIDAKYTFPKGRALAWSMEHPTKTFSTTLTFPKNVSAMATPFGFDDGATEIDEKAGYLFIRNGSWLLPNSGVAIELVPLKVEQEEPGERTKPEDPRPSTPRSGCS
jgi:hypothetical protein